MHNLLSESG